MNKTYLMGGVAVVAVLAGVYWLWPMAEPPAPVPEPVAVATPVQETNYPVPVSDHAASTLPELESSDPMMLDSAKSLLGASTVARWLIPTDIVRHLVATVDNLPRKKYAERQKPIAAVPGRFEVAGTETFTLSASNAARYATFVDIVQGLDANKVTQEYFRVYPLLQKVYRDLGYPDGHFNNRVVAAIDDLLAAPQISEPIQLVRPNVLYEYADPKLESLSAGQKIMIRIGPDNATRLKAKLKQFRAAIVAGK